MEIPQKISIPLGNDRHLIAEIGADKSYNEIFLSVVNDNDGPIRDLCIVRQAYTYPPDSLEPVNTQGEYEVLIKNNNNTDFDTSIKLDESNIEVV